MGGPRFVADPAVECPQLFIDGFAILYHRPSGMTHILAPPVPELLAVIAGAPGDAAGIVARLSADHDVAATSRRPAWTRSAPT